MKLEGENKRREAGESERRKRKMRGREAEHYVRRLLLQSNDINK